MDLLPNPSPERAKVRNCEKRFTRVYAHMVERGTVDNKCKAKSDDFQSARTVPLWPELSLPFTQLFLLTFLLKSLGELLA